MTSCSLVVYTDKVDRSLVVYNDKDDKLYSCGL